MTLRQRIINNYIETLHFQKRKEERKLNKKHVLETINKGLETRLLEDKVKFTLKNFVVIASTSNFSLITAYEKESLSKRKRKKLGLDKKYKYGTGRDKRKSVGYRRAKNECD